MRLRGLGTLALVVIAGTVWVAGCGDDEPAPPKRHRETVDKLPKLPPGWHRYVSHRAGFAIGRAPGWRAKADSKTTLLRSPDRLVAVSISADRSSEAVEIPLGAYAHRAAQALPRFKHPEVGKPHLFKARYPARAVAVAGSKDGVRQRLLLIAMRRDRLATYTVLVAANAERNTTYYSDEALRIVRTLRGRPAG